MLLEREQNIVALAIHAVVEIVYVKLELTRVFVLLIRVGIMYFYGFLLSVNHVCRHAVVPCIYALVGEPLLLSFLGDGAAGLVEANDIHVVMERAALRAEHLIVGFLKDKACLCIIIVAIGTYADAQGYQQETKSFQHEHFKVGWKTKEAWLIACQAPNFLFHNDVGEKIKPLRESPLQREPQQ